jgi:peptide deformylase
MIITNNEEALRVKCEDVKEEEIGELRSLLERELAYSAKLGRQGIGLALPQIGIAKKMAIVRINDEYKADLVNCRIEKAYDQAIFRSEGCLSFPGKIEDTMRAQEICVVNNLIYPHSFIATGLMAVVIQHELDHLDGVLMFDRAIPKPAKIKMRPNDPCHCGSGKKYKKCCNKP